MRDQPARFFMAAAASLLFWLTCLEAALANWSMLARGFLFMAAGMLVHFTVLFFFLAPKEGRSLFDKIVLRSGFVLSAVLLLLFVLECGFRTMVPLQLYEIIPDDPREGPCLSRSDEGRLIAKPGFQGRFMHPEFPGVRVEINEFGLRDGLDEAVPPAPGDAVVLVLGDSVAFGTGVSLEETFHEVLERYSEKIVSRPLRVYSGALPGYDQFKELQMLNELAPKLRPDVVIVALYEGNDFFDNLISEARSEGLLAEREKDKEGGEADEVLLVDYLKGVTRLSFWLGSSAMLQKLRPGLEILPRKTPTNRHLDQMMLRDMPNHIAMARDRALFWLARIRERCQEAGADLIVMVIPAVIQASPDRFELYRSRKGSRSRDRYDRTSFHDGFVTNLEEQGFVFLDMMEPLESREAKGEPCYYQEGHWNTAGHACASECLVPLLAEMFANDDS